MSHGAVGQPGRGSWDGAAPPCGGSPALVFHTWAPLQVLCPRGAGVRTFRSASLVTFPCLRPCRRDTRSATSQAHSAELACAGVSVWGWGCPILDGWLWEGKAVILVLVHSPAGCSRKLCQYRA